MTTGTLSFYPTATTVITAALRAIRAIDSVQGPTTQQTADGLEVMNFLLTSWQTFGLQLWCIKTSAGQTPVLNQATYTVGTGGNIAVARPTSIIRVWLRENTALTDGPMEPLSKQQYDAISSKSSAGTPTSWYYDPAYEAGTAANVGSSSKGNLSVWPVADASTVSNQKIFFTYSRPFVDFDAATDTIDMPQEWFNALKWNLAFQLMPEYGNPFMDQDRIKNRAETELQQVLGWDAEKTSISIRPDQRVGFK